MTTMDVNIEFERECYKCYGASRWPSKPCETCTSTGRVATELGDQLMEFLKNQQARDTAKGGNKQ